jgi:hypothetical protein
MNIDSSGVGHHAAHHTRQLHHFTVCLHLHKMGSKPPKITATVMAWAARAQNCTLTYGVQQSGR